MKKLTVLISLFLGIALQGYSQIEPSVDLMKFYTHQWEGARDKGGRPLVSDELLDRLLNLSIEEVWGALRNEGYRCQYEGGWQMLQPGESFVGRVVTAQYMPSRPDINDQIKKLGEKEGRIGSSNSWPIDMLKHRDVYVADSYGKVENGTLIGDNLGNAIYSKSKTGVIFDGSARDMEGLKAIEGFNAFVRAFDPSYIMDMMLTSINMPIRIGNATVCAGDAVLAKPAGVIFVPAYLVEKVVLQGEFVVLRDKFGHEMLRKGVYTPGQIDARWTDEIKGAFLQWLDANPDKLPMSRADLDKFMEGRTW